MDLTFFEAARGADKVLRLDMMDTCKTCNGKGNKPGSKIATCGYCHGSGTVSYLSCLLFMLQIMKKTLKILRGETVFSGLCLVLVRVNDLLVYPVETNIQNKK